MAIRDFARVYSNSMILPGVTVGEQAIIAAKSLVTRDVEPNTVVAGAPAKPVRGRQTEGHEGLELHHLWLKDGAFQHP